MLKVQNIRAGYKKGISVLENVGFSLENGRILAVLGPNGSGKTTLLRCINAMIKPWSGEAYVDDIDIFQMNSDEIARCLGYVAQRNEAGRITVFDAVLLGRIPYLRWQTGKENLLKVDCALRQLNLEHIALRYIDELSGGELQKVYIARALVQEPKVLLLDEPTNNLDLKNQIDILNMIRDVAREHQMAVVMTMHDLNMAFRFADNVLFLKQGKVFSSCLPEQINEDIVADVYGVRVDILRHDGEVFVVPNGQKNLDI